MPRPLGSILQYLLLKSLNYKAGDLKLTWIHVLAPLLTSYLTLAKLFNLSEPWFFSPITGE